MKERDKESKAEVLGIPRGLPLKLEEVVSIGTINPRTILTLL